MEIVNVLIQFLLGFGVIVYLIWPLISAGNESLLANDEVSFSDPGGKVLEALSDLEYEHETRKINDADYSRLRNHYLERAEEIYSEDELDSLLSGSDESEVSVNDTLEEKITRKKEQLE